MVGVLATLYFMLSQDGGSRFPLRALQEPQEIRSEASVDPAVNQLLQFEKELAKLPKNRTQLETRLPSAKEDLEPSK